MAPSDVSASVPSVLPLFATPFGVVPLPEVEPHNAALAALFAARAATAPNAARPADPLCYQSRDDLLDWPEPEVRAALQGMLGGVSSVAATVNEFTVEQLGAFALQARAWFTIVQPDGAVPVRSQPLSAWCGVYCVAAPERSATRLDSGVLRLYESRLGTMFSDATNATMQQPYTLGHSSWVPVPGQLAVFPAYVLHEIALLKASSPLVLLLLKVRFVAPGQTGWTRW